MKLGLTRAVRCKEKPIMFTIFFLMYIYYYLSIHINTYALDTSPLYTFIIIFVCTLDTSPLYTFIIILVCTLDTSPLYTFIIILATLVLTEIRGVTFSSP